MTKTSAVEGICEWLKYMSSEDNGPYEREKQNNEGEVHKAIFKCINQLFFELIFPFIIKIKAKYLKV